MSRKAFDLGLVYYNNPILEQRCSEVTNFDNDLQDLIIGMGRLLQATGGLGLAAPQVGVSKRVFLINTPVLSCVCINPELEFTDIFDENDTVVEEEEGCLSLPGINIKIPRHKCVCITCVDRFGKPMQIYTVGQPARVIQHENDHLNGILIFNYADKIVAEVLKDHCLTNVDRIMKKARR